jgi:hypothetical protein
MNVVVPPHLNSLTLQVIGINTALTALLSLSAPNLLSLHIHDVSRSINHPTPEPGFDLLKGKFARLESLELMEVPLCIALKIISLLKQPSMTHIGLAPVSDFPCPDLAEDIYPSYIRSTLQVTSFSIHTPFRPLGNDEIMKYVERIVSTFSMPHLQKLLAEFTISQLPIEYYTPLARKFGSDPLTATFLFDRSRRVSLTNTGYFSHPYIAQTS